MQDSVSRSVVEAFHAAFDGRPYEVSVAPVLSEDVVWHVAGANPLAGTYTGVGEVLGAMRAYGEASGHTLRLSTMSLQPDTHHVVAIHDATATSRDVDYQAHEVDVVHVRGPLIEAMWSFSEDQTATDRLWSTPSAQSATDERRSVRPARGAAPGPGPPELP